MTLHEELLEKAEGARDVFRDLANTISEIDDDVRAVVGKIDRHSFELSEELSDFLNEIREELVSLQGKLYK